MAFSKDQKEPSLPIGADTTRSAVNFLPRYFRTTTNQKFLNGTLDQLISVGSVDKINAYIGRKNSKAYVPADNYIDEISTERSAYQLEPATIVRDSLENVTFFSDYNDYINQLVYFNSTSVDHSKINAQEFYSWNPNIDWDKFVNFQNYYWHNIKDDMVMVKLEYKLVKGQIKLLGFVEHLHLQFVIGLAIMLMLMLRIKFVQLLYFYSNNI
jgi:hypothetical protein